MGLGVTFEVGAEGRVVTLGPGAIVGRMRQAALPIDDPRISEAHALVALRVGGLRLLALRGRMSVGGKPQSEVALLVGRRVLLGGCLALKVLAVELPETVVALLAEVDDARPIAVDGVLALGVDGQVHEGFAPEAAAVAWSGPSGPMWRAREGHEAPLIVGERLPVGPGFSVVSLARARLESTPTLADGRFDQALRIVLLFDAVHVHLGDRAVTFDGIAARALSLLVEVGLPVAWEELARPLWPELEVGPTMRQRWDQLLTRVRHKLRAAGVRGDLVRSNRQGLVELVLGADDRVEDRS